jgi:hypothetical protein
MFFIVFVIIASLCCSYFKTVMIPPHTLQIIFYGQVVRNNKEQKPFTNEKKNAAILLKPVITPSVIKNRRM